MAKGFSPNIELVDERTIVFDLTGSQVNKTRKIGESLYNDSLIDSIAISDNLYSALLLAQEKLGVSFSYNNDLDDLSKLPVNSLDVKKDFVQLMDSWGIYTFGDFCQLPEDEIVARFGKEIINKLKIAKGTSFRAADWNFEKEDYIWHKELDGEIESIEPLNFILSAGITDVFSKLEIVGYSTQSANLTLSGENKTRTYKIKIVFPTKKEKIWLNQIIRKVESHPPGFAVDTVSLSFSPCKPRTIQNDLFSGVVMEPENFDLLISKLKKVVKIDRIGVPRTRDSWRKGFFITEEISSLFEDSININLQKSKLFSVFYHYKKNLRVEISKNLPKKIVIEGRSFDVKKAGGPWRKKFDWQKSRSFESDEWDAETSDGKVLKIVKKDGKFFLAGGYD